MICACGKAKSYTAFECMDCYRERIAPPVVTVKVRDIDPVRDAFDWIILQSQGEIS